MLDYINELPEDAVDDEVHTAIDGDEKIVALSQSCHLQPEMLKYLDWNQGVNIGNLES